MQGWQLPEHFLPRLGLSWLDKCKCNPPGCPAPAILDDWIKFKDFDKAASTCPFLILTEASRNLLPVFLSTPSSSLSSFILSPSQSKATSSACATRHRSVAGESRDVNVDFGWKNEKYLDLRGNMWKSIADLYEEDRKSKIWRVSWGERVWQHRRGEIQPCNE